MSECLISAMACFDISIVEVGVLVDRPVLGKSDDGEQQNEPMIALNTAKRVRTKCQ